MFKDYYLKEAEKKITTLNEVFEELFEADGDTEKAPAEYVKLTTKGIEQLFTKNFENPPSVGPTNRFKILVNSAETQDEIKHLIKKARSKGEYYDIVLMKPVEPGSYRGNTRVLKDDIDSDIYTINAHLLSNFNNMNKTWKESVPASEKEVIANIYRRLDKMKEDAKAEGTEGRTSKDSGIRISGDELNKILDIYSKYYPKQYVKGIYYLYDVGDGAMYKVVYNKLDPVFKQDVLLEPYTKYEGPSEDGKKRFKLDGRAQEHESVQVLGLFMNAPAMRAALEEIQYDSGEPDTYVPEHRGDIAKIVAKFEEAIKQPELRLFNRVLEQSYKNFCYSDWYDMLTLAAGCSNFKSGVIGAGKKVHIIFDSISQFKKLESAKLGYKDEADYGKVSTVDLVVSSDSTAERILELLADEDTKLSSHDKAVLITKAGNPVGSYYQISLKLSKDGAFLGRSQRFFAKMYKMVNKTKEIYDGYISYEDLITESVLSKLTDTAKAGVNVLKKLGKSMFDRIKNLVVMMNNWSRSTLKKIKDVYRRGVEDWTEELYFTPGKYANMTEAIKYDVTEVAMKCLQNPKKFYDAGNQKILAELSKITSSKYSSYYKIIYANANDSTVKTFTEDVFKKQIFNYSFLKAFDEVLMRSVNPLEKYIDEVLGLYIEAVYGATSLPLWKVYSAQEGEVGYEYVGTSESDKAERKHNILTGLTEDGMHIILLDGSRIVNGCHNFRLYVMSNMIREDGKFSPTYVNFRVSFDRTNLYPTFLAEEEIEFSKLPT